MHASPKAWTLAFHRLCFQYFVQSGSLYFPPGKGANVIRGALGMAFRRLSCPPACLDDRACRLAPPCAYRRHFAPRAEGPGPSGFQDPPRPFVLRAAHLNGSAYAAGRDFPIELNLFDVTPAATQAFVRAMEDLWPNAALRFVTALDLEGTPRAVIYHHSRAAMPWPAPLCAGHRTGGENSGEITLRLLTPTEMKGAADPRRPDFATLIVRLCGRISLLRSFYGPGPLEIDFRALVERARCIELVRADLRHEAVDRRAGHTGQSHPLRGWTGELRYAGELAEFLPYLEAGRWTGVGSQTVWGNGWYSYSLQ